MAVGIDELIQRLNGYNRPVIFLGDGVPVHKNTIAAGMKVPYTFAPSYMNRQRAAAVGALGIRYYQAGKYETAMEHQPDYLRASQAERERAEREKKSVLKTRKLKIEDAAAIAEMERIVFSDPWSEKSVLETVNQPNAICYAAEKAGRLAGYVLAYEAAGEVEIARIAVDKDVRHRSVGHHLMNRLIKACAEKKITKILLDVRQSNEIARAFYAKEGFENDGIRPGFYSDPEEDAVLMSKVLEG